VEEPDYPPAALSGGSAVPNRKAIGLWCAGAALAVVGFDAVTSLGVADGMLYCFIVALSARARTTSLTLLVAACSTGLIFLGMILSPPGAALPVVLLNRGMSIAMVWTIAALLLWNQRLEREREKALEERAQAVARLKVLQGLIPICAWCKRIRDGEGHWHQLERYLRTHSEADFTHSLCPNCAGTMGNAG
jgi:hypothetical protein